MIFIISDAYNSSKYAYKSHIFFASRSKVVRLDYCSDIPIFNAAVRNTILHFRKALPVGTDIPLRVRHWGRSSDDFERNVEHLKDMLQLETGPSVFRPTNTAISGMRYPSVPLGAISYISKGMAIHADERKCPGAFKAEDVVASHVDALHPKPFVYGKDVSRWMLHRLRYLEWGTDRAPDLFSRPTFVALYQVPEKLISARVSGSDVVVAYDNRQVFHNHTVLSFVAWNSLSGVHNASIAKTAKYRGGSAVAMSPSTLSREDREQISLQFDLKYVLAVMNSTHAKALLQSRRQGKFDIYPDDWKPLPIPSAPRRLQEEIVVLVDAIMALWAGSVLRDQRDITASLAALEQEIEEQLQNIVASSNV